MQGHQPPDQAAQSHIQPGLECLQGWGIHNSLGNLFSASPPSGWKNFLLISNLNLPCLSLKPFSLVLSLSTVVNSCYPSCLYAPFKYWKATMRSSRRTFLPPSFNKRVPLLHLQLFSKCWHTQWLCNFCSVNQYLGALMQQKHGLMFWWKFFSYSLPVPFWGE